ncbi:helicase domain protein (plasmid) [Thioalkalivibrio sp. K90mix]|uniref:DEAD/DEAH box helicase n=1 Tax=Thioalkalivibrio sp. (strain K90mix) TaxID=396595 RepID=UPI000195A7A9|nr:DEAD/DEAH box helicase [Thioalkalivibrio sp. K90mix]ADC73298.1 helicase domain protein [Thioalkalivibrio sp. K90mix]
MTNASISEEFELGRLSTMGLKEWWHVSLLLPEAWEDYRSTLRYAYELSALEDGSDVVVQGVVGQEPSVSFSGGRPRTQVQIRLSDDTPIAFSLFGDTRGISDTIATGSTVLCRGRLARMDTRMFINNAALVEPRWAGKIRPVYPAPRGVMKASTVRERVSEVIEAAIPEGAAWVTQEVQRAAGSIGIEVKTSETDVREWLQKAHAPDTPEDGMRASRKLEELAALAALAKAYSAKQCGSRAHALDLRGWRSRAGDVPFTMTEEQEAAVEAITQQMNTMEPQRHLLSGDVGTGKTVVFGLVAAATYDAGYSAAVMLPNEPLAQQVARELGEMWPDISFVTVAGDSVPHPQAGVDDPVIFVGTTALLSRINEDARPRIGLVVVDEQQKYSVAQREQLAQDGAHLLEATATCIPRTMALIRYGAMQLSQLRTPHTPKEITTQVVPGAESKRVFSQIQKTLEKGHQVLVVYPLKEGDPNDRMALSNAIEFWKKRYGDRVAAISGSMEDTEKEQALARLRSGAADILIGTTVVEVGLNAPGLRHIVIADASRYGLMQLHQLRGRVARQGGKGLCSLIVPDNAKERTLERFRVLESTQDGFEVAEHDMRLRGFGDLGADGGTQHGGDETFLFGKKIDVEVADKVAGAIRSRIEERYAGG